MEVINFLLLLYLGSLALSVVTIGYILSHYWEIICTFNSGKVIKIRFAYFIDAAAVIIFLAIYLNK